AMAATLAVCAIFLPVVFIKGVIGKFFLQFGVTLSLAVLLSYLEAVTLAPARLAQLLDTARHGRSTIGRTVDRAFDWMQRVYHWTLSRSIKRPLIVLAVGAAVMAGSFMVMKKLPGEFTPSQDQGRLLV